MARPAGSRGELTRERILDEAERIFAESDYSATRLEDVALAVDIRRASIIYYFPTKQQLYEAVQARAYSALVDYVGERVEQAPAYPERLFTLLDATLDFLVARPTLARIILRDSVSDYEDEDVPVRYSGPMLELWERVVREGRAAGELVDAAPIHLVQLLGAGIMFFAATAGVVGSARRYDPVASDQRETYRALMHAAARSVSRSPEEPA